MSTESEVPRNRLRLLREWRPGVEAAVDWAVAQYSAEYQRRGLARGYYEFMRVTDEVVRACPSGLQGLRVADVGCGGGVYSLALRYLGADVTAIDHFVEYEADCDNQMGTTTEIVALLERHGVRVIRQDFEKDGFPQARDTFDIVLFLAVIEHLHGSPRRVLGGLWQMLRPGGLLVVTTPNHAWIRTRLRLLTGRSVHDPLDRWWREPFHGHVREYTMDELTTMLRLAGFDVIRANISNWVHAASRTVTPAGERWTTRFTLIPPSRLLVLASLVLGFFSERLRYSMLTIGRRPFVEHPAAVSPNTLIRPRRNT